MFVDKTKRIVIYAVDAGSLTSKPPKFSWISSNDKSKWSSNIVELKENMLADLRCDSIVALGYECPLFIPCPSDHKCIGKARVGECGDEIGNKPYTAAAGACATMTGLSSLAWILSEIGDETIGLNATTRWEDVEDGKSRLFLWEAFVSGKEKAASGLDQDDALLALESFESCLSKGTFTSRVDAERPFSFAGALLIWAGLSSDMGLLETPCLVLRPSAEKGVAT